MKIQQACSDAKVDKPPLSWSEAIGKVFENGDGEIYLVCHTYYQSQYVQLVNLTQNRVCGPLPMASRMWSHLEEMPNARLVLE